MPTSVDSQQVAQIKYTIPFAAVVNQALLKAAARKGMEPSEVIQRATIKSLIQEGLIEGADADRIKLFWALVDRTVRAARNICTTGRFASSITLDAIHECMKDTEKLIGDLSWTEGYRAYVRDDIFKSGNPEKGPINREIGFRIRAGIGGVVEKGDDGKPRMIKVLGEIIQSYTAMADYDREAFKSISSSR